nr:glycoside hydrolase family 25 protein [Mucilaginibacter straminoryzae]
METKTPKVKSAPKPRAKSTTTTKRKPAKKKNQHNPFSLWLKVAGVFLLLILLSPLYYQYISRGFSNAWRWLTESGDNKYSRKYHSFDIRIPNGFKIHGIDVSYAQGKIDWQQVSAMEEDSVRVRFAFIKATEGESHLDPFFTRNWREAPKAGIICGAYHYFRANKSGLWQALFYLNKVQPERGDLPPVVDIEELSGATPTQMRHELQRFLERVKKDTHTQPIIYSSLNFYQTYLAGHFDNYPLWLAHYYTDRLGAAATTNWHFWQHSDEAHIKGIRHRVDFNVFKGDSLSFEKLRIP